MENRLFRKGEISDIDTSKGMVRVVYPDLDNSVSAWLPILVQFSEHHKQNFMYSVGQTVYVLHIPEMLEEGVVIGTPMRKGVSTDVIETEYKDGGLYKYDASTGELIIKAISKITIDVPEVEITGNLTVKGNSIIEGNNEIKENLTVKGHTVTEGTTKTSKTKLLDNHTHTDKHGGETGPF